MSKASKIGTTRRCDVIGESSNLTTALFLHQTGQFDRAAKIYREIVARNPDDFNALHYLGLLEARAGHFERANPLIARSLELQPSNTQFRENYATVLCETGRYVSAAQVCDEALRSDPANVSLLYVSAVALLKLKRLPESLERFDKLLTVRPDHLVAINERGSVLAEMKEYDKALAAFQKALSLDGKFAEAYLNVGSLFGELEHYEEAKSSYEKALTLNPKLARAWSGLGNILRKRKLFDEALTAFDKGLALESGLAEAWLGRGNLYADLRQYNNAFAGYDQALRIKPDLAKAWVGRGNVHTELKQYDNAVAAYDRALSFEPNLAEAWLGRGNVHTELKQYDKAVAAYDRALSLQPNLAEAWHGRGNLHAELKQYDDAFAAHDRALSLQPDLAEVWLSRGNIFTGLGRHDDAFAAYDRARTLDPDLKYVEGLRLHTKTHLCNWTNREDDIRQLLSVARDQKPLTPFVLLSIPSTPTDQLQCAKTFVADQGTFPALRKSEIYRHDRIRIAYLSADFREHAIAYLTAGLFEHHDKSRFEITGISYGSDENSGMQRRLKGAFEHFVNVAGKSDREIAELVQRLEIDIAVDLMGFTQNNRLNILARRPAPIQVNYLGYPGTTGASYMDYIIADRMVIPPEHATFYTEKVAWLPDTFMVNDISRQVAERTPTRRECGLPDKAFVFSCFNNTYKITPEMFHIWMKLLAAMSNSVLWLGGTNPTAQANLRREAEQCDVSGQRLIFASRIPDITDHLARLRQADLFLDTLPYNAHATASDALWAGLPVLTCLGTTFAGRVAASLLKAVGLEELIAQSLGDYEAIALQLAEEPARLAAVKDQLARNRNTYSLFNTERFTHHIEAAFLMMWERHQRREPPDALSVSPA